jgi:aromatic-L-amino-acid/L-tryptophan decarboxylase
MTKPPARVPDLDWAPDRARSFGTGVVELWTEWLEKLPSLPVASGAGHDEVRRAVTLDVPEEPMAEEDLLAHMRQIVLEDSMYPGHPGFMAYISGAGTVPGAAADLLAAGINQNVGGWRLSPAATEIELHLTRWFARQFGLPESSGGLFVSGGAVANFVALKTARDLIGGLGQRIEGIHGRPRMTIYASEEVHSVAHRAADMLGMGTDAIRVVPVDSRWRMRIDALRDAISADVARGLRPVAVIGTAGTVATGSIDPLNEIADVCTEYDLWFHVDGAYGGPAILADDLQGLLAGVERADSIAFDPHKWLYTPHSGGCVLMKDFSNLEKAFTVEQSYTYEDKEATGHGIDLLTFGPQFSRGFNAFKVWISLLAHGTRAYGRRISHDAALARYLAARVEERDDFELMAPAPLSICCFRFVPRGLSGGEGDDEYLSRLNERIMTEVQLDGRTFYSNAVLNGLFVLRVCIVNFRTEAEHLERVLDVTAEIGRRLDREMGP